MTLHQWNGTGPAAQRGLRTGAPAGSASAPTTERRREP